MNDCVFCKIVKGEIPTYTIAENDKFLAFLDLSQFTPGHTIVIPKQHYESIWDVPNIDEYYKFVKEIGNHFRSIGYKYVDTLTMGRGVFHSHVHVIPHNGNKNDWRDALQPIADLQEDENRRLNPGEMKTIQKKFQMN